MKNFRYMMFLDVNLNKPVNKWRKMSENIAVRYCNDFNSIIYEAKSLAKYTGFDIIVEDRFSRKDGKAICYQIKPFMKERIKKSKSNYRMEF